jgi:hypothetical protein
VLRLSHVPAGVQRDRVTVRVRDPDAAQVPPGYAHAEYAPTTVSASHGTSSTKGSSQARLSVSALTEQKPRLAQAAE